MWIMKSGDAFITIMTEIVEVDYKFVIVNQNPRHHKEIKQKQS